uniref:Uncharacterized protein n=1 Tax=Lepeophtheirus salmonis TaxID=72036 RepID=A0A0K2UCU7_LEPSM
MVVLMWFLSLLRQENHHSTSQLLMNIEARIKINLYSSGIRWNTANFTVICDETMSSVSISA